MRQYRAKAQQILCGCHKQQLAQFVKNTFPGDFIQQRCQRKHGFFRCGIRRQVKTCSKADTTQNTKCILFKANLRRAHGTQDLLFHIFLTAEGIGKTPGGGVGHGIDGEVPTGKVSFNVVYEGDPIRVTAVRVAAFGAEGGDLHHALFRDDTYGSVLYTGQHQCMILKSVLNLLRTGVGTKIVIVGHNAQQQIPHAAAHGITRIATLFQYIDASQYLWRQGQGIMLHLF